MRILKFGGKSLETKEKTQKICEYIKKIYKKDKEIILIVSAMGNKTNELASKASTFSSGIINKRELDSLLSIGETESSTLIAIMLNSLGVPAKSFQATQLNIRTFGDYQNSKIYYINKTILYDCLKSNTVAVVAGFQGVNQNNEITTLGRGGSDTTATAIGAIFNTPVEIYSDFNGVYSGDPRALPFKKLKHVSFKTMQELSESGAKVLDSRAIKLARQYNIKLISKSSTQPELKGTEINSIESNIVSITSINNLCSISIIFDDACKLNFIIKSVIFVNKTFKIYNLHMKDGKINLIVNQADSEKIISILSKKLKLIK